jgi:hypothetical protein
MLSQLVLFLRLSFIQDGNTLRSVSLPYRQISPDFKNQPEIII